jgi:PD-(D/E)XK nuclease superfamily
MQITIKRKPEKKELWSPLDGITQSFISEWLACRERARLAYKEGWSSLQTSNSLTFGTLCHSVLEENYKQLQVHKEINVKAAIKQVIADYKKVIGAERLWTPEDEQVLQLNQGYLEVLLPEYWRIYLKKDSERKYLAVEKEFKNAWKQGVPLRGKMDVVYETNGEIWIMDHKTKYTFEGSSEERLGFDLQGMFYILNWWLEMKTMPTGFIQNMIQRPRLRKGETETLQHFIGRVQNDVDVSYFKRIQVTVTKEEFDRWFKEFKEILDEICGWAAGLLPNYRNNTACMSRYGACRFSKVCSQGDMVGLYKRKILFPELSL